MKQIKPAVSLAAAAAVLAVVAALAFGFILGRAIAPAALTTARAPFQITGVPDVRQSTGYSCGAAALQAVLAYWGTSEREDRLAGRLNTTPEQGTHPADIVRVAREFGLQAELREGLELADLETALSRGLPVIVDLQAWRAETAARAWTDTWEDGHYVVLVGMDAGNLYFEDPSLLGSRGFIPRPEFLERWHDYEGEPPLDDSDRKYIRTAIFISGAAAPAPPPALTRIN